MCVLMSSFKFNLQLKAPHPPGAFLFVYLFLALLIHTFLPSCSTVVHSVKTTCCFCLSFRRRRPIQRLFPCRDYLQNGVSLTVSTLHLLLSSSAFHDLESIASATFLPTCAIKGFLKFVDLINCLLSPSLCGQPIGKHSNQTEYV